MKRISHFVSPESVLTLMALVSISFLFPISKVVAADPSIEHARSLSTAFEGVANRITPALVNIKAVARPQREKQLSRRDMRPNLPPGLPAPFRDFFEHFGGQLPFDLEPAPQHGLGSGVIVDEKGHILTNNHVIAQADEVTVRLSDNREFEAKIVGTDPKTDLAVIKIDARNLQPAKLGDSDQLKIGEWVIAAGTPFGLDNTITAGIVSAKGRSIMGGNAYEDFIQTDAAINPGNSGGPLANLDGEVVGINTAIFSRTGGYMGVGFAIPINLAKSIMGSLINDGKVVRGWLGVVIQELNEDLASSFKYDSTKGALVSEVAKDGPADDAGILQGDIITEINGKRIDTVNDLRNMVAAERPGTSRSVTLFRNGKLKRVTVKLGELPQNAGIQGEIAPEEGADDDVPDYESDIGIRVEPLTDEVRRELGARAKYGVVITGIQPESLAAEQGLRPGDIIKGLNGKQISSLKEFQKVIGDADLKRGLRFIIESGGVDRFVFVKKK